MGRRWLVCGLLLASTGCSKTSASGDRPGDSGDPLIKARAAIVAHNYGSAADAANAAIAAAPHDPAPQYELARAEALRGDEGDAMTALDRAVTEGLANPSVALSDAAFDGIRQSPRFAALQEKAQPSSGTQDALQAGQGTDAVSISGPPGHEVVRAGDVLVGGN